MSAVAGWLARGGFRVRLALVAGLAFAARLIHIACVVRALDSAQILDAAYYLDVALVMLGRQRAPGLEGSVGFASFGYPHVLAWIYAVHASTTSVLVVQAVFGGVTTLLVGALARDVSGNRTVGLVAAGLFALDAPAIFYDGLLLVPGSSAFLAAVLGWSLYRVLRVPSWQFGALSGLAIGLSALLRASQLLLLPFALVAVHRFRRRESSRANRAALLALIAGTAACVTPVLVQERLESGAWLPITANAGMNLWIGNHRGATGTHVDAPFLRAPAGGGFRHTLVLERDSFLAEARRRSNDPNLSLAEANGFWSREAAKEIARAPGEWLGVMLEKVLRTGNDYESRTNASFELMAELSAVLRYDPLRFGVIFVLAAFGTWELSGRRRRRARWALLVVIVPPVLTCLIFFVSGEYRHPAAPALVIPAALALHRLGLAARSGSLVRSFAPWPRSACVLAAFVLAVLPTKQLGPAKDRKAYAEALASPSTAFGLPTRERYSLARRLLLEHGASREDRILSSEAALLVESNQAIQFRDRDAAERLVRIATALRNEDLRPDTTLDAFTIERIRRNSLRRVAQLCRQPFVRSWHDIAEELSALGCFET